MSDYKQSLENKEIEQQSVDAADRLLESTPRSDEVSQTNVVNLSINQTKTAGRWSAFWSKKMLFASLAILLVTVVGLASLFLLNKSSTPQQSKVESIKTMGAEITIADGTVQISKDNTYWKDIKIGEQISQGDYIKTTTNSRAVVSLDDGSAIRINSSSLVQINILQTKNVKLTNISGTVYTRVVPSERQFSVAIAEETYKAMGTAYITTNTDSTKGVEVYHSKVKLNQNAIEVSEGKYYYTNSTDPNTQKKVGDIPIDKIKQDQFLVWNYEQDKKVEDYKDKLGYLTKIDEKPTATTVPPATNSGSLSLSGVKSSGGIKLLWQLNGLSAPMGFKIVKATTPNPVYGVNDYKYINNAETRSYLWNITNGGTYHFRVCIYDGQGCNNYSNNITLTAPYEAEVKKEESNYTSPSGSLALTHNGGKNFSWALSGNAPKGYKLVWSTSPNPVYPGNSYQYYSSQETKSGSINPESAGTYYVRVCIYTGGGCTGYSNQITVTVD